MMELLRWRRLRRVRRTRRVIAVEHDVPGLGVMLSTLQLLPLRLLLLLLLVFIVVNVDGRVVVRLGGGRRAWGVAGRGPHRLSQGLFCRFFSSSS